MLMAQKVKTVAGEYTYAAPQNVTLREAKDYALQRAKIKALADEFGTTVSMTNSSFAKETSSKQERFVELVNSILFSKHADPTADTSKEERTLDLMVYKLYGLTYDEVKVVDPETTITEEEYEREISKQL